MTSPADSLGKEIESAQSLLQLLKQEEACLVKADVEGVSRLTMEKASIAAQMSHMAKNRHGLLRAAGFEGSEAGMTAWSASAAATEQDRKAWEELLSIAKAGKELNRVNGLLLAQQIACNQNALNVLQGNPAGSAVYGPNGQTSTRIGGRKLVVG